jgi:hypothetical protein
VIGYDLISPIISMFLRAIDNCVTSKKEKGKIGIVY